MRTALCIWLLALAVSASAQNPMWLEFAPGGRVLARAVVETSCPQIAMDGKVSTMAPRSAPDARAPNGPPAGQRLVCEKDVTGAAKLAIAGTAMKMPPKNPRRIVVIGDTGCRIKAPLTGALLGTGRDEDYDDNGSSDKVKIQDCNDPVQWPFAALAASAAAAQPDLIVHVGDYLYRESACPSDHQADCGGSPSGDQWDTWNADFFTPARPLLTAAPWIFVRGNHEICARAGKGWFYYLDPGKYAKDNQCADSGAPFQVKVGEFQAWVLDSSSATDVNPPADQVAAFTRQFQQAATAKLSHAWLLSHRPIWAAKAGEKGERDQLRTLNATLEKAWAAAPIPGVDLIVAGHTHLFELLSFKEPLPPQAVIGNSGTDLAHEIKTGLKGQNIGGTTVANGNAVNDFGFALIEPAANGKGWSLHLHDSAGRKRLVCSISGSNTQCGAP